MVRDIYCPTCRETSQDESVEPIGCLVQAVSHRQMRYWIDTIVLAPGKHLIVEHRNPVGFEEIFSKYYDILVEDLNETGEEAEVMKKFEDIG